MVSSSARRNATSPRTPACSSYSAASRSPSLARSVVIAPVTTSSMAGLGTPNLRIPAKEVRTETETEIIAAPEVGIQSWDGPAEEEEKV